MIGNDNQWRIRRKRVGAIELHARSNRLETRQDAEIQVVHHVLVCFVAETQREHLGRMKAEQHRAEDHQMQWRQQPSDGFLHDQAE